MQQQESTGSGRRLLVFNCHEAWVYQLGVLGYGLDIVIGLKGMYKSTWDQQMRPLPANSRLISLSDAIASPTDYYCIIGHNTTDLMDVKDRDEPRLMVIHSTIQGRAAEERSQVGPDQMKQMLANYLDVVGAHAVATSDLKSRSWAISDDVVPIAVDAADYPQYSGEKPSGLRICNFIESRKHILLWDFCEEAFAGIDVRLVGHNPGMPGVSAAANWSDLKQILRSHRFYIHTADPQMEDGYNMATLEAMAAGLPVLGNQHPGSPIRHGKSGFLSDDPAALAKYARLLIEDRYLAQLMGAQVRKTAIEEFSMEKFKAGFLRSIELARAKWAARQQSIHQ